MMHRQKLDPGTMLRWREQHLYVTSAVPREWGFIDANAAAVTLSACQAATTDYALVTPKSVTLAPDIWTICGGAYYRVLIPHELDEVKNEYQIRRKEDC